MNKINFRPFCITVVCNLVATVLCLTLQYFHLTEANIVVVYILSVLITAASTQGYFYGIVASILSTFSFNLFFALPIFSLAFDDPNYVFTLFFMLTAAIFISTITSKMMRITQQSNKREQQAQILYSIASAASKAGSLQEIAAIAAKLISSISNCYAACYILNAKKRMIKGYSSEEERLDYPFEDASKLAQDFYCVPIYVQNELIALICLESEEAIKDERIVFDSIVLQISIAMERELFRQDKDIAHAETEQERFKNGLLRAVSHDLRTPLTGILGASEILIETLQDSDTIDIAKGIREDASWLQKLVENILNLTRIQEKRLSPDMHPEMVEEIVSSAIARVSRYAGEHEITVTVPSDALFVPMDSRLIEQVLINLLDNAIKHTCADSVIHVLIWQQEQTVWFEVSDNGGGLQKDTIPKIFDTFYTHHTHQGDSQRGVGLGLAICREIIQLHHGNIIAKNNETGGATFCFCLPLQPVLEES